MRLAHEAEGSDSDDGDDIPEGLDGRLIGAIEIHDRFSIVEVPEDAVDHVIDCLRRTTLRNRKARISRDRGPR